MGCSIGSIGRLSVTLPSKATDQICVVSQLPEQAPSAKHRSRGRNVKRTSLVNGGQDRSSSKVIEVAVRNTTLGVSARSPPIKTHLSLSISMQVTRLSISIEVRKDHRPNSSSSDSVGMEGKPKGSDFDYNGYDRNKCRRLIPYVHVKPTGIRCIRSSSVVLPIALPPRL